MKLTILGNCGPFPGSDKACSGYLLEHGPYKILLDCGSGVLGKLQKHCRLEELTHIILSHLHYDHAGDMFVLRYAIEGKGKRGTPIQPISLYLPPEPEEVFKKLVSGKVFKHIEIKEELKLDLEDLKISFKRVNHPILCYASRFESEGKSFVFSGDTAWTESIIEFAKNADLFLCDAGLLEKYTKSSGAPHMTAFEAGLAAKRSEVKRLLLTHFWPEDDTGVHLEEARENYPEAELAQEGKTYKI